MKLSRKELARQQAQLADARAELAVLQSALEHAYDIFNSTADPALLEASILEIGALQSRYGGLLRSIKAFNGDLQNGTTRHSASCDPGSRRCRTDPIAAASAAKADPMGV